MNEQAIQLMIGEYGWMVVTGFVMMIFRGLLVNTFEGLMVMAGKDLEVDDTVYIGADERKARIVRMGMRKTIFHMEALDGVSVKMPVPNERLKSMIIKKRLPNGESSAIKNTI